MAANRDDTLMRSTEPDAVRDRLHQAARAYQSGDLSQAAECLQSAAAQAPGDARIHYNLGLTLRLMRRNADAVAAYQRALALDPFMVDALYNLGNTLADLNQSESAIGCYQRILRMGPASADVHHNLSRTLNDIGRWEEARTVCDRGLDSHPSDVRLHRMAVLIAMLRPHRSESKPVIARALANSKADASERQWLRVQSAIRHWIVGDVPACRRDLDAAGPQDPDSCRTPVDKSRWVYHDYLSRLVAKVGSEGDIPPPPRIDTAFVIGDSHCLGWAHRTATWPQGQVRLVPRLVMGVKAFHLADAVNPYQRAFADALTDLPPDSHVVVTVGEIDCRSDGGIFPYWRSRKHQLDLEDKINSDAARFVAAVIRMASGSRLRLIFCGIPAPTRVQAGHLARQDLTTFVSVSRLFSSHVREIAARYGYGYIDLHGITAGPDGWADGRCHLDDFHLAPDVLVSQVPEMPGTGTGTDPVAPSPRIDTRLEGLRYHENGELDRALSAYSCWLRDHPGDAAVINNAGGIHLARREWTAALACFEKALRLAPELIPAACNAGQALMALERPADAAACFQRVLAKHPFHPEAGTGMGDARRMMGDVRGAAESYCRILNRSPDHFDAMISLAALRAAQGRLTEADALYRTATEARPESTAALNGLGQLRMRQGRPDEAVVAFDQALAGDPDSGVILANALEAAMTVCDWNRADKLMARLDRANATAMAAGETPPEPPFLALVRGVSRRQQATLSVAWADRVASLAGRPCPVRTRPTRRPRQLTVGYLSHNFTRHPVGFQIRGLFRHHDRSRFRIIGYSTAPPDTSDVRKQIADHCDAFVDIADIDDAAAADRIRSDTVDILVDLMGHTRGHRMAIAARRPAAIQICYLGFLGPVGASFFDYTIADNRVVPPDHGDGYREHLIRMPDCYQVNDDGLVHPARILDRSSLGLPSEGVVYAAFNNPAKIDFPVFAAWMVILARVPGSVIWLQSGSPGYRRALRTAAADASVDPDRLIFADAVGIEDHLSRLASADLGLDTWRYNGGATTSNALWAGVPVIARFGRTFAGRMSASALAAAGLADLIADSPEAYVDLSVALGRNAGARRKYRRCLEAPTALPLFQTRRFTRYLESAYETVWHRWATGQGPADINVDRDF